MRKLLLFTMIGILMMAGSAFGDALNIRPASGPLNLGTLQTFFDGTLTPLQPNNTGINALTDQSPVALFQPSSTPFGDITTLLFYEGAAYAPSNIFGIYKAGDPTVKLNVFLGAASPPSTALVSFFNNDIWLGPISGPPTIAGFGLEFGFFINGPGGLFYSEDSLNPGLLAQMLVYQNKTSSIEWYIGVEDLNRSTGASDNDFEDMVVGISEATGAKVPEPISLILLGSGLAGAGLYRRLRKPK